MKILKEEKGDSVIIVNNVSKKFKKEIDKNKTEEFYADDDISLEVKDGEILGLLGPNGAGKTTLLRIISGIMTPNSGEVIIDGLSYKDNTLEIKKSIASLSGNTKLYKDFSGMELLKMFGRLYEKDDNIIDERIEEITNKLNISSFINQKIANLSTGQFQKINIARCLIHNPKNYILDEATSGLDIISSQIILDFIKEEKKEGKSIIYSTHYMEEAENICDRVAIIHKGKIIKTGTPKAILKETKTTNLRDAFFSLIGGTYEN